MKKSILIFIVVYIGYLAGIYVEKFLIHECPEPVLMTRPQAQIFLRKYDPSLIVDGDIGDKCNAAWKLYEDEEYKKEWCEMYEGMEVNK